MRAAHYRRAPRSRSRRAPAARKSTASPPPVAASRRERAVYAAQRRAAGVDGVDDLGVVEALEVDRGDAEDRVTGLALDDDQRNALTGHLDGVRVTQLVWRKASPHGLAGGHPAVFVTLTAPSFGLVHTRRLGPDGKPRRCRPRRDAPICPHGARLSCARVHEDGDPCVGEPLCSQCFDHTGAVVWNNALSELWRRTTIYLPRALARRTGMTQRALRAVVRASYVKVAEYQRRGLVHLHVVIRLDRAMPAYRAHEVRPPAARFAAGVREPASRSTVEAVDAPLPDACGGGRVRWGGELEIRPLGNG